MTRNEIIHQCNYHLRAATTAHHLNHHEHYADQMQALLDLLTKELFWEVQRKPNVPPPERSKL